MFSRVMNKVRSPDRSSGNNHSTSNGQPNAIESFYEHLGDGLHDLESSLSSSTDSSSSFEVEWLVLGVSFLHSVHLETFSLVEAVWLPAKSALGPDSLTDYLGVSMTLLDTCNNLKEALNQLDTYQMSIDLILTRLMSAASLLQNPEHPNEPSDPSAYLKSLEECKKELDRLEATEESYALWVEKVPKHDLGQEYLKSNSLARTNSAYTQPATPSKKKDQDVSFVLYDVQVVTSFVSCVLLWVITGQAGDKESPTELKLQLSPKPNKIKEQKSSPWPTFLFRLKEKVAERVDYIRRTNSKCFMKLQDVTSLQNSLKALRAELEAGFRDGKFAPGADFAEKVMNMLEEKREKLAQLTKSLENISAQLNEMFGEIIDRRKKVLDICENRPLFHAFSI